MAFWKKKQQTQQRGLFTDEAGKPLDLASLYEKAQSNPWVQQQEALACGEAWRTSLRKSAEDAAPGESTFEAPPAVLLINEFAVNLPVIDEKLRSTQRFDRVLSVEEFDDSWNWLLGEAERFEGDAISPENMIALESATTVHLAQMCVIWADRQAESVARNLGEQLDGINRESIWVEGQSVGALKACWLAWYQFKKFQESALSQAGITGIGGPDPKFGPPLRESLSFVLKISRHVLREDIFPGIEADGFQDRYVWSPSAPRG